MYNSGMQVVESGAKVWKVVQKRHQGRVIPQKHTATTPFFKQFSEKGGTKRVNR
jgi:hypothetical protein